MKTNREIAEEIWKKQKANLMDRRGVKNGFYDIDEDVMQELDTKLASFITAALDAKDEQIDELKSALKDAREHCVCERFKTKGFDYGETHKNLGRPLGGKRWLTPRDMIDAALAKIEALKNVGGENEKEER